jgi:fucose 4-O-acetylase-like acetyltransferase
MSDAQSARLGFLDRYKGFLAVLVVLIHTGISYGGAGGWMFTEEHDVVWVKALATCLGAISQSFVLGAFFFASAYFLPRSLEKKGPARFFLDRLLKLGIPYLLYCFLVMPILITMAERAQGRPIPFGPYFDSGPLWFVEALFLFSVVYLVVRLIRGTSRAPILRPGLPRGRAIVLYVVIAAAAGFAVRLLFPVGKGVHNLQLGFFPMYVILFAAGIKAGNEKWLEKLAGMRIAPWAGAAAFGLVVLLPLLILGGALEGGPGKFLGGLTWQAAAYAAWEAVTGTSLLIVTFVLFARARWRPGGAGESFGSASFGIYVLHAATIVPLAIAMVRLPLHPALKYLALSVCGVCVPWAVTILLRRIPPVAKVL